MPGTTHRRSSATSSPVLSTDSSLLPSNAPSILRENTINLRDPKRLLATVEDGRKRKFQSLVRRYMNQLLYGCERPECDTPTCYTYRKRQSSQQRRFTLLSARIIACTLAGQDDPFQALCPGKPVVPTLDSDKPALEDVMEDEARGRGNKKRSASDIPVATDKGLKDPKSFTQQLYSTMTLKMVEWIGLPPPPMTSRQDHKDPDPQEPPKIRFGNDAMDVMDTGRITQDSEAVSHARHQEILQQQPKKRGLPVLKDVTPTPHSNPKMKMTTPGPFMMAPPALSPLIGHHEHREPHHRRNAPQAPPVTPTGRSEKHAFAMMDTTPSEAARTPQTLKRINRDLVLALKDLVSKAPEAEKRSAAAFVRQSIFYTFSTPSLLIKSFGRLGGPVASDEVDLDPDSVDRCLETLFEDEEWKDLVVQSVWRGVGNVFTEPGKGLSSRDAAAVIAIALHVLANCLVPDEDVFSQISSLRASGTVSAPGNVVLPDMGLENDMGERLMKRILRALDFRVTDPGRPNTAEHVKKYLRRCFEEGEKARKRELARELGVTISEQLKTGKPLQQSRTLSRCSLEWTRAVFMRNWNGSGFVRRNTIVGSCMAMFQLLFESNTIDRSFFHTGAIGEKINPYIMPVDWFASHTARRDPAFIHLLDYPYVIPLEFTVTFFRSINLDIMKKAYEAAFTNFRLTIQMGKITNIGYQELADKMDTSLATYLVAHIRRQHVVEDALNSLLYRESRELLRPMKVKFADGEEGLDQGGVQQEFFVVLMQDLLRPDYGMFTTDERSRMSWFSIAPLEGLQKFELVGLIVGLAVYNGITLRVNFPKALYMKLLGWDIGLEDIADGWPELYRGLGQLLDWDDGDVEDIFFRTYAFDYAVFGQRRSVNMLAAKERGLEYLDPPVAKLKQKHRVRDRRDTARRERIQRPNTAPLTLNIDPESWLPLPRGDPWLGEGLNDVMDEIIREATDNYNAAQPSSRQSGERSYTVSFRDLSEVMEAGDANSSESGDEEGEVEETPGQSGRPNGHEGPGLNQEYSDDDSHSWSTVSREDAPSAADIPLPPDVPEDYLPSSPGSETDFDRASRMLEAEMTVEEPSPSRPTPLNTRQVSFSRNAIAPSAPSPPDSSGPSSPSDASSTSSLSRRTHTLSNAATMGSTSSGGRTISRSPSPTESEDDDTNPNTSFNIADNEEDEAPFVTNANREEYVRDYISWLTDRSIRRQYEAFERGFYSVCSRRSLSLFTPGGLQELLEGDESSIIDVDELRAVTVYEDGYTPNHRVIHDFWEVVEGFSEEQKRQLLEFATSSARLPVGGLRGLSFHIAKSGATDKLPSSFTCFGKLMLPPYENKELLKQKLEIALQNTKGFGTL